MLLPMNTGEEYAAADPCPHIVIDNFLPEEALDRVRAEIPDPTTSAGSNSTMPVGKKLASKAETQLGAATRFLLYQLNSSILIEFLKGSPRFEDWCRIRISGAAASIKSSGAGF
jgi:hypothetical protein